MSIKLIIFDLDGTLVDSIVDIKDAVNFALAPTGMKDKSVEEVRSMVGGGISLLFEKALNGNMERFDESMTRFFEYYFEHTTDNTVLYEGVEETIRKLDRFKKGVISNKRKIFVKKILKELEIDKEFDQIFGSDSAEEKKPSPKPIEKMLDILNISAGEAIIVGDSEVDILAGKAAGIITIAVTYGYRDRHLLFNADTIINNIKELTEIIDEYN